MATKVKHILGICMLVLLFTACTKEEEFYMTSDSKSGMQHTNPNALPTDPNTINGNFEGGKGEPNSDASSSSSSSSNPALGGSNANLSISDDDDNEDDDN